MTKQKKLGAEQELEEQTQVSNKELEEQKDKFMRLAAEYDNYRKRSEREKEALFHIATASTILPLLPIADSLERASGAQSGTVAELQKGLELVNKQLKEAFEKLDVERFGEVGDTFSAELHNAIAHTEDDSDEKNKIEEVFQYGYRIKDKVIRFAVVKVKN